MDASGEPSYVGIVPLTDVPLTKDATRRVVRVHTISPVLSHLSSECLPATVPRRHNVIIARLPDQRARHTVPNSRGTTMFLGRLLSLAVAGLLAVLLVPGPAPACPFCPSAQQTLLGETNQAHLIVFGTLTNAQRDPNECGKGTTDKDIHVGVKGHQDLKGKKKLTLPRYVPADPKVKSKYLVFCEIYKGELDPYRGEAVPTDSKIAEYLKGAIELKDKDMPTKLQYFFKHFDSPDWYISGDAFQEFSNAEYKDVRVAAAKMDPDHLLKMLKDPNTSIARYGLVGLLLGHCGTSGKHAKPLRDFVSDPKVKQATGLDGLLAGVILLDPKAGLESVAGLIKDTKEDFTVRYAALRCLRFFWEYRDD